MSRRVLVATVFQIPHAGGASTHVEQLNATLSSNGVGAGLLAGQHVAGSFSSRLAGRLHRLVCRDQSRVRLLEKTVDRLRQGIDRSIPSTTQNEWIVHTHDPLATCAALRSERRGSVVVQTVHGPWSRERLSSNDGKNIKYHRMILDLEREAFAGADMLLPVDNGQGEILREDFAVAPERMRVIPNAVDVDSLSAILPAQGGLRLPTRFFLVPRRLVSKNGVEYAIRAYAKVPGKPSELGLVIAGDGPLRVELEQLVADKGLTDSVVFTGNLERDSLLRLLKCSLGVIVPSVPSHGVIEATSYSVLEAMACGVPVIASSIGGIAEIMTSDEMGFRVRPAEPGDIASAMQRILCMHPVVKDRLIQLARKRIVEQFGLQVWFSRIRKAYDEAERLRTLRINLPHSDNDHLPVASTTEPR